MGAVITLRHGTEGNQMGKETFYRCDQCNWECRGFTWKESGMYTPRIIVSYDCLDRCYGNDAGEKFYFCSFRCLELFAEKHRGSVKP